MFAITERTFALTVTTYMPHIYGLYFKCGIPVSEHLFSIRYFASEAPFIPIYQSELNSFQTVLFT